MWPQGTNKSFLIGIHDYLKDINQRQSSSVTNGDKKELDIICKSLKNIISNNSKSMQSSKDTLCDSDDSKATDLEQKTKKFFEWAQTYTSVTDHTLNDDKWQQLKELFNFQHPQYCIPSDVDVTVYQDTFLYKHCKEKGNELMKNKKIKSAIQMYSKAIQLLEKEQMNKSEIAQQAKENEARSKVSQCELAIIFCNRSAAWVYLQEYQKAVDDAVFALKYDPLLTKAWIRKGMAEQELKRYKIAYGDYQVALNQSKETDNYYKFLNKKIKQCFDELLAMHQTQNNEQLYV